jgi:hypothetical protein
LDEELRGLQFFAGLDAPNGLYLLSAHSGAAGVMSNACVSIKPDGLYFCDNGGAPSDRATMFRSVIDLALQHSQRIEVELL